MAFRQQAWLTDVQARIAVHPVHRLGSLCAQNGPHLAGAPRSMKMGNILSPRRYDVAADDAHTNP
jgi:hypothetical protein